MYKTRRKRFQIVGDKLLYKKWLHLNFNNGRNSASTRWNA